jgi:hypothetical protein
MIKAPKLVFGLIACVAAAGLCYAGSPAGLSGSIAISVVDSSQVPQMGAAVLLLNRNDRLIQRALTNDKGEYVFASLVPDVYSVRVTLARFLPAVRRDIVVQPGMQSLLSVNLATVFSSIELVSAEPGQSSIMSDDWKWVLRTAGATRPVLRYLPKVDISDPSSRPHPVTSAFSDTRGLVQLSAGGDGFVSDLGNAPDIGTAFGLETSIFGKNNVEFVGDVGYSSRSGIPTAAFRTSYSRQMPDGMSTPELTLSMQQLLLPTRAGVAMFSGQQNGVPQFRTMNLTFGDHTRISDRLTFDYGASVESVSFLDRLNYVSPYGDLTYQLDPNTRVEFTFSSGLPPSALIARSLGDPDIALHENLATLAAFPRVSLLNGDPRLQRSSSYELGYHKRLGSRAVGIGVYREAVSNAAITVAGAGGLGSMSDLLPDLFSETAVFDGGQYYNTGYMLSFAQNVGDKLTLTLMYGDGNALKPDRQELETGSPDELRAALRNSREQNVTAKVSCTAPWTETHIVTSYQWTDFSALTPEHAFLTQGVVPMPGLNLRVRQPLPALRAIPGRLEATVEMNNMLAQGYVPMLSSGRRFYLMQVPRSVRGGLSFVF